MAEPDVEAGRFHRAVRAFGNSALGARLPAPIANRLDDLVLRLTRGRSAGAAAGAVPRSAQPRRRPHRAPPRRRLPPWRGGSGGRDPPGVVTAWYEGHIEGEDECPGCRYRSEDPQYAASLRRYRG